MALALDGSTPAAVAISSSGPPTSATTASFTAPNTSVIWVFVELTSTSANTPHVSSITNTGTGLTWTKAVQANHPGLYGSASAWWAYNASSQSITITANLTNDSGGITYLGQMTTAVFTGASSTQNGATSTTIQSTDVAISASLTTTQANSWVWGTFLNTDNSYAPGAPTVGASQTLQAHLEDTAAYGSGSFWTQSTASTTASPGAVSLTVTAIGNSPGGNTTSYVAALVEVVPTGAGGGTVSPLQERWGVALIGASSGLGAPTRDPGLWPFSSLTQTVGGVLYPSWNTPVGSSATYYGTGTSIHTSWIGGGGAGINCASWSQPVYFASNSDPLWTVVNQSSPYQTVQYRIPAGATPAAGGDKALLVVDPTHTYVDEIWSANIDSTYHILAGSYVRNNLYHTGFAEGGTRAWGGSALGGLIRSAEITNLNIPHALACGIGANQLVSQANSSNGTGHIYPATLEDSDWTTSYSGYTPMGSWAVLPSGTNTSSLGLTTAGVALANACLNYGVMVADRAGGGGSILFAEPAAQNLTPIASGSLASDWNSIIVPLLRVVSNNTAANLASGYIGGGTSSVALAPTEQYP